MAHDIVMTNRENLIHWIDRFQQELSRFREAIASGESANVLEAYGRTQMERDNYMINGPPRREQPGGPIESISLSDMLFGSWISGQFKKQQQVLKDMEAREKGAPPGGARP
jgi:hypothetical protein